MALKVTSKVVLEVWVPESNRPSSAVTVWVPSTNVQRTTSPSSMVTSAGSNATLTTSTSAAGSCAAAGTATMPPSRAIPLQAKSSKAVLPNYHL